VDYTADGRELAVSDLGGRVALLDASSWSSVTKPVQLAGPVTGVTLAPDGRTTFVVTRSRPVTPGISPSFETWALLDLRSASVVRTGRLPETDPLFEDFSPDGLHVTVGFQSGRVWILDTGTGHSVDSPPPTGRPGIYWVGWSPDGSHVLSADDVGTLELWDAATGAVQNTVTVPGDTMAIGQFHPGTTDVTILDGSGRVLDWDTRPEHAVEFACQMAGRDLTAEEWHTYVGTDPQFEVCPS
jgi:WD40 repeat protein